MFGFGGLSELMFIFFLAMLIFGPEKLPEIGRMLAKGMAEVRKASNELKRTLNAELAISEQEIEARRRAAAPPPPMALAPPIPAAAPAVPWVPEAGPAPAPVASEAAFTPSVPVPQADQESQPSQAAEASTQAFSEGSGPFDHESPAGHEMGDDRSGIVPEPIDDRSDIVPEPR